MLNHWLMSFGSGEKVTSYCYTVFADSLKIWPLGEHLLFSKLLKENSHNQSVTKIQTPHYRNGLKKYASRSHIWCLGENCRHHLPNPLGQLLPKSPGFRFLFISSIPSPFQSNHHTTSLGTRKEGIIRKKEEIAYTEHTWKRSKSQIDRSSGKVKS